MYLLIRSSGDDLRMFIPANMLTLTLKLKLLLQTLFLALLLRAAQVMF